MLSNSHIQSGLDQSDKKILHIKTEFLDTKHKRNNTKSQPGNVLSASGDCIAYHLLAPGQH